MGKDLKGRPLGIGLSQRKDGRYQARFTSKRRVRVEKNFSKITDAREWLEKEKYLDTCFIQGTMTVNDWYESWIANFKEGIVRDSTVDGYKQRYKHNIKFQLGNMNLSDVKQIHCQTLLTNMFNSGKYSSGTIKLTAVTLHAMFQGAVENDYIQRNPATGLKIKTRDNEDKEKRVLTREEEAVFKEYAKGTLYYNAYCFVLETGLRAGEISGLQWDDIDFDLKYLFVKRTMLQDYKKGGFYTGSPKTQSSKRKVPLTDKAIEILNEQKKLQNKNKFNNTKWNTKWNGLVFTTVNGNPVGCSTYRNMMIRIVANINKDRMINNPNNYIEFKHCYMHSLRHTFATRCIEKGIQPKTLQRILGHSTIQTTMDLYVHVTDEFMCEEIKKMNAVI